MRVVQIHAKLVWSGVGKVIGGKFFECGCQSFGSAGGFGGVGIGFELVLAGPGVTEHGEEF